MSGLLKDIIEQGGLFAVLVLGLLLGARLVWWVAQRLFAPPDGNSKGGLLVEYFDAHKQFLAGLEQRDRAQSITCKQHTDILAHLDKQMEVCKSNTACAVDSICGIAEWTKNPSTPFSTAHFDNSIVDLVNARLLELRIKDSIPQEEADGIRLQIEQLFRTVGTRHQDILNKFVEKEVGCGVQP